MAYTTKTYPELVEVEKAAVRNRITEADTSEGSDYDIEARVHATVVHGNQAHGAYLARQVLPQTADGAFLIRHGDDRGIPRRAATSARGVVALVPETGNVGTQAAVSVLTTGSGVEYTTDEAANISLPSWTGKTVGGGTTIGRLSVLPNVSGLSAGDRFEVTTSEGVREYTIKRVLNSIQAVELYGVMASVPATSSAITPKPSARVAVTAVEVGASGNREPNEAGTLSSPTNPVSADMTFLEMTGGADQQSIDSFKSDIVNARALRPASGNLEHWRRFVVETPGVGMETAFIYPGLRGMGTVTAVPFGVAGTRRIGDERNAEILAHVRSEMGALDDFDIAPLSDMGSHQDITLEVQSGIGFEPDWTGQVALRTSAPVSTTTRLQLVDQADLSRFQLGDRIVVPVLIAGRERSEERRVAAIVDAGTNDYRIDLDEPLSSVPQVGATTIYVTPGGPLYGPISAALEALFNTLGPGDTSPASRWPFVGDSYPAQLNIIDLGVATRVVPGVANVRVVEPAEDQVPLPLRLFTFGKLVVLWV